jgi:hypothetical protein
MKAMKRTNIFCNNVDILIGGCFEQLSSGIIGSDYSPWPGSAKIKRAHQRAGKCE